MAVKTRVTVESLTEELDAVRDGALAAEQYGAAKAAIDTKAKLHGFLVERHEVGQPGDFAALDDAAALLAKVRAELGDDAADLVAAFMRKGETEPAPLLALPRPDPAPCDYVDTNETGASD